MKKLYLLLILSSFSAFGNSVDTKIAPINDTVDEKTTSDVNEILHNEHVGQQFISISKSKDDKSTGYSFIDRTSIALHPYNKRIRVFSQIVNYTPAIEQDNSDGNKISYRSLVIEQFANCDKMEMAKGNIQLFANYFGEGDLIGTNDTPNRWVAMTNNDDELRRLLIVACSLPITE
ncbi:hypothetical protein J3U57_03155 [Gilliamella sp. B3464]|uniref:surface-adhesin E family protein n=1 Tax=unclassified Gilliamella TaxID=2685620 RepID=UPI002269CB7C|nr:MULTISPECIES: surface-adhesin E family protein [unclassified Gilliamella]MCX8711527.1 hypothetical protein [Gilliamella sp. B3468]MCX8726328.1 hypothetical protein [Gilliamella sp. B2838]MCX8750572.1 hypothetical protein [Gilliamella sp. B3464]